MYSPNLLMASFGQEKHTFSECGNPSKPNDDKGAAFEEIKTRKCCTCFTWKYDPNSAL